MRILSVVGARPNFMKVAPIARECLRRDGFEHVLVHTGQHYDTNMSRIFLEELGMPKPDAFLNVGSGSHAVQTARVLEAFEPCLDRFLPDVVLVVGDVNSTLACALAAAKRNTVVAHVEAGLRSFDRSMPEEINRLLTDQLASFLLTPSPEAEDNLLREGIPAEKIHFVGNVMIDTLMSMLPAIEASAALERLQLSPGHFAVATFHRPSNVDQAETLASLAQGLNELGKRMPILFPAHPRTVARLHSAGIELSEEVRLLEPMGYVDFLALVRSAALVITDSGGLQEETTWLGVPCLTLRPNTERPVTVTEGTNRLVASTGTALVQAASEALDDPPSGSRPPELWDGATAGRIVDVLSAWDEDRRR